MMQPSPQVSGTLEQMLRSRADHADGGAAADGAFPAMPRNAFSTNAGTGCANPFSVSVPAA
jgi:hypothetical protein